MLDQDKALDFYVGKLGMEVNADSRPRLHAVADGQRSRDPEREILLERPGKPTMDADTTAQIRELVTKGAMGGSLFFPTADAQETFETLKAKGVEITEEPTEQALRDRLRHPRPVRQQHPHRPDVRVTSPI